MIPLVPGAVDFIIEHAEIDIVFVQDKKVKELLNSEFTLAKFLKLLVCFTSLQQEDKEKAVSMNIKPYSWNEFLNMGKENPTEPSPLQPLVICAIMYTSGTSGEPTGVILTHENMTASCCYHLSKIRGQGPTIWLLAVIYLISGVPGAYILWTDGALKFGWFILNCMIYYFIGAAFLCLETPISIWAIQQVYMYFRGSGKATEMKRETATSTMMAAL